MADDQEERDTERNRLQERIQDILIDPRKEELDEGVIYYRWHYSDDTHDYGIQPVANGPRMRWLLVSTGVENRDMFFYSVDPQDLVIDPMAGTPRIGRFAPMIPWKSALPLDNCIIKARKRTMDDFDLRLAAADDEALQNHQPAIGQIHCRWHFTDPQKTYPRKVITRDNTQAIRDLFTEYLVKYPNQFWVSCHRPDLELRWVGFLKRPIQGPLLPTGVNPSTTGSSASAAASTSTAGTGQTHDPPLPTDLPATKKFKSGAATTEPIFFDLSDSSESDTGTSPSHRAPSMPKSTPTATVSKPPTPLGTTNPFFVPTDSSQDLGTFVASFNPWTHSAPVDTDASLSSAADPIPLIYLASTDDTTTWELNIIEPNSGITGTSSEETVEGLDPSQLTTQPIGALTAGTDDLSEPLLETNDPNDPDFSQQFMNLDAVPTGGTAQEQPEEEDPGNEVVVFDINEWFKGSDENQ